MIGRDEGRTTGKRPGLPVAADGPDLVASHEPLDTVQAAGFADFPQVAEHPASPINLMTARMGVPDELQQSGILDVAIRYRGMKPSMKSGPGNPQDTAHQRDGIVMPVLIHKAVLHSGCLAKYRAAFFCRSRSSSTRRISARKRSISLLASSSSFVCCSDRSGETALTHLYRLWAEKPRRAATSGTE